MDKKKHLLLSYQRLLKLSGSSVPNVPSGITLGSPGTISISAGSALSFPTVASENFDDIANGSNLQDDANWSDWNIVPWGISAPILVANPTGSAGYIYTGDTRSGRAASWDGGNTYSSGSADFWFRLKCNNMDYGVGVWITDGNTTDSVRVNMQDSNASGYRGYEFACIDGGSVSWAVGPTGTPPSDTWVWFRLFLDWDNNLGKLKYWTGDIGDEPGTWTHEQTGTLPDNANLRVITSATTTLGQAYIDDITETKY